MATQNDKRRKFGILPLALFGVALGVLAFFAYETLDDQDDIAIATQYEQSAETPVTSNEILYDNNQPVDDYALVEPGSEDVITIEPAAGFDETSDNANNTYDGLPAEDSFERNSQGVPKADNRANEALTYNK